MGIVTLVPIQFGGGRHLLNQLASAIALTLRAGVRQQVPWFDAEQAYDPARGQYSSTHLLEMLLARPPRTEPGIERMLCVTSVDLFIPVLTFVFGEAQLNGRAAAVSTHRLRSELYGLPRNPDRLGERLVKEAIHELGHTIGLVHCYDSACVMHASTYVEEIDLKTSDFCAACRVIIAAPWI